MNTTLIAVNSGGVAKLSDDTFWRIAPLDLGAVFRWQIGDEVSIGPSPDNMVWQHRLAKHTCGGSVGVNKTQVRF